MYRRMYREGRIVAVLIVCDRCRRQVEISVNEMPDGWYRPALCWPGDEQDVCGGCLTLGELRALGELLEAGDDR